MNVNGGNNIYNQNIPSASSINFETLSLENPTATELDFKIYPNPTSDIVHIDTNIQYNSIELYDILGKRIFSIKNTNNIDVSKLKSGLYLFKITIGKQVLIKKLVVE